MGRIAKVLAWAAGIVTSNPGGAANLQSRLVTISSIDAPPLTTDYAALMDIEGTGDTTAVGTADPANQNVATPGEHRQYARTASGAILSTVYQQADGSVHISNMGGGSYIMQANGEINLNGARVTPDGRIFDANNVELGQHRHGGIEPGTSQTDPPTQA